MKRVTIALVLVLAGTAVGIGAAEIVARFYDDVKPWHVDLRPDIELKVFKYMPNSPVRWTLNPDHPGIDSLGFRDDEIPLVPGKGEFRMAVVGDSIPFGVGVDMAQSFPQVMERIFRAQGVQAQVINAGVPGYNGIQVAAFLEEHVLPVHPSKVVVSLAVNDLDSLPVVMERNGKLYWEFYQDRDGPDFTNPLLGTGVSGHIWLWRHSHLYRLLCRAEFSAAMGRDRGYGIELSAKRNLEALERAFDRCKTDNVPAVAVLVPLLQDEPDPVWAPRAKRLLEGLRNAGITVLDIEQDLKKAGGSLEALRVNPNDKFHLNPRGHELVAEILLKRLDEIGFLPPRRRMTDPALARPGE